MHERNECSGSVGRPKWHYIPGPLDSVGPLEREFLLAIRLHSKLMIPHWGVEKPVKFRVGGSEYSGIAPWDGVLYLASNCVERDVIDAETPNKVVNVEDVFLMRFRGK